MISSLETSAAKPKWMVWLPLIVSLMVLCPLLYFFWSKWKFILGLIVILAIAAGIILLAIRVKAWKKRKVEEDKGKKK
jgi:Na+-driven multidrug efflux pump